MMRKFAHQLKLFFSKFKGFANLKFIMNADIVKYFYELLTSLI